MTHILVVDDDRATVGLLTLLLEMDGFQVSQSPQLDVAFEIGKNAGVDAFIIDCHLMGENGIELLKRIRHDPQLEEKLVIMTSGKDLESETMASGADLFLLKPFSPSDLSSTLSTLLEEKEAK